MSSPPVNIPHKADSGSRRSALTSAFEELTVLADQKTDEVRVRAREPVGDGIPAASAPPRETRRPRREIHPARTRRTCPLDSRANDERRREKFLTKSLEHGSLPPRSSQGEAFSAHVSVDQSLNPSVVVGGDGRELRGPTFRSRSSRARDPRDPPPEASDLESASFGRQHGSFSAISFLQQSHESDGDSERENGSPGFEFNGGRSDFTSAEPNEMSYLWNSIDAGDGNAASDTASEDEGASNICPSPEKEKPHVTGSLKNTITGSQIIPPRVVVVHVGNDDDEGCAASAGRKQRGSFSSLLLLEAHELSTLDGSPNSQRRGAMQAHIEDELVARGLEKGTPVASTRVAA